MMNDLAVSFFVALAGHVLNVYAQVKDQYQSFNGNPVSFLNCYGDPDITQDVLFGAAPADFTMTPRWAQFCALSEATQLCGYDRDPTHFYFDGIGLPHYDRPGVDQIEIHRAIQICYIKCSCINTDPTKALDRITPDNRERIFEFNFDYGLAVQYPSLLPDDTPVYVYGFGGVSETDEDEYEFSDEEEDEYRVPRGEQTDAPISAHAYVGAPSNRPVCDESINLAEEMPMSFFHFVHAHVTPGVTLTATSFCAHSFFGGADRSNMGAICKNPSQNEKPVLSIDDIRKAVQYTTDFYPRSLYISLAVSLATSFCHAFCTCSEDSIQDQVESKAAWESAKQGMPPSTGSDSLASLGYTQQCSSAGDGSCNSCNETKQCQSNSDCGTNCTCNLNGQKVDPAQMAPAAGLMFFCAIQAINLASNSDGNGKREIAGGARSAICACNATYASGGCCSEGLGNGIIWEGPGLNIIEGPALGS